YDGTIDNYQIQAYQDDLYIGPDTDTDALKYDGGTNQWVFTSGPSAVKFDTDIYSQTELSIIAPDVVITDGDFYVRNPSDDIASINVGQSGNQRGRVIIFGKVSGTAGGQLTVHLADDYDGIINSYGFLAINDDLHIGPNTDADALKFDGGLSEWNFTSGTVNIGTNDKRSGLLNLYSTSAGNPEGGRIQLYTGADYDGTIAQYRIQSYEDDLYIGPNTDPDALKYDGGTSQWDFTSTTAGFKIGGTVITDGQIADTGTFVLAASDIRISDGDLTIRNATDDVAQLIIGHSANH
ncbi:unnamed protein product, partial [marine sediment metagenome]